MKNKKLAILLFIFPVFLLTSCGAGQVLSPTVTPTRTLIPTTTPEPWYSSCIRPYGSGCDRLCSGDGLPFPGAPAYEQGQDTHPFLLYQSVSPVEWKLVKPSYWDVDEIQIVVCAEFVSSQFDFECKYQGGKVAEHRSGTFKIDMYALGTGELIRSFTQTYHDEGCPAAELFGQGGDRKIITINSVRPSWIAEEIP
jgi:hypothetical protein